MIGNRKIINQSHNIQTNESLLRMVENMWRTNINKMNQKNKKNTNNENQNENQDIELEDIYDGDDFAM